ncbi:FAD:protein FMN transferase [Marinobacterium iners]|uniref:FAD:protein FMN transferase n=1 Tax=Marinobacterium iners DSM 11526 TaxID=1122198 RepID=A0A1H4B7R5_9GAMM|nr:FAD:protein FMN transferase [Marinobacterium iners]SEA44136.1 thiamine biosynthesis lipoprotein [Marinobacterium iners DSM 11526]
MANQIRLTKWLAASLLAVFVLGLLGCDSRPRERIVSFDGLTMGTSFSVKWVAEDDTRVASIRAKAGALLAEVNRQMSTYIDDSELSKLNSVELGYAQTIPAELMFVLQESQRISEWTDGAFDVTVGPLVNLWGFGPDGRIIHAPTDEQIEHLRERIGYRFVELIPATRQVRRLGEQYIDLSAIAKGYGVDALANLLEQEGVDRYLVEIGGELRAEGLKPDGSAWKLAIEAPVAGVERVAQTIISLESDAVATSGDYRNYFEEDGVRYSHTIDPRTARPITHRLASVTVIRPTCAEADALATALMVMGEEQGYNFAIEHNVKAFFISKGAEGFITRATPDFEAYLN